MKLHSRRLRAVASIVTTAAVLSATLAVAAPSIVSAAGGTACPITTLEQGSTTVYPALVAARSGFQSANAGCTLTLAESGSNAGITALINGTIDIAASSRPRNASVTNENNLNWFKIGADAMVLVVRGNATMNFISNITLAQVEGIWEGTITNWNQLGGPNVAIVPRSRATSGGSYSDFLRLFSISSGLEATTIANTGLPRLNTSEDESTAACNNDYQITYSSLANLALYGPAGSGCLKALTLNGTAPSVTSVQNGTYGAPRELFLAMRKNSFAGGTPAADSGLTKAMDLINYMYSTAGQNAVASVGFVQVPVVSGTRIPNFDVNLDGAVGLADIGQITSKWGQTAAGCNGWIRADVTNDAAVGLADIGQITSRWGGAGFVAPN